MKEVKADAEDLEDDLRHGVADSSHHMLKVDLLESQLRSECPD